MLPPLVFTPYLRPRIWGGSRLRDRLGRTLPDDQPYGESWELSALPEHDSIVAEGPLAGATLGALWRTRREELLGNQTPPYGGEVFPLLIKWLDCNALLSVQVHPDDVAAQRLIGESCGKEEAWLFLDADPDGWAYFGVKGGTTPEEFARRMDDGTVEQCLNVIHPRPGEVVHVPPGSVHALGAGQLLLEIEQPSDATFRVFDYNRPGPDGRPRELHRQQALAVIDWNRQSPPPLTIEPWTHPPRGVRAETLLRTESFCLHRLQAIVPFDAPFPGQMTAWVVFEGAGDLLWERGAARRTFHLGDTVLLPATCKAPRWRPGPGGLTLIGATLPT
jgi:mannose-6-phosphate isomerase